MTIDFSPIVNALVPSDMISVALFVATALAALYVVLVGITVVLVTLRGGSVADQVRFLQQLHRNSQFKARYRRESRQRQYAEWKRSKGLK